MSPRFSIVIPLYNKRRYIRRAIDSVISQSFRDFELIVVDDGSTDGSQEMVVDIADLRMKLIRQDNAGEGAARNRGIKEAKADWIAFLDADDMWVSGHLDNLARLIERFPESGLLSTGYQEILDGAGVNPIPRKASNMREIDYFAEAALRIGVIHVSAVAVKRTAIQERGGFGAFPTGADLECWAKLALNYPITISDLVTSVYIRGTGGVMEQLARKPWVRDRLHGLTLEDISPSVKLLSRALRDGGYNVRRASIESYINSRLISTVREALYHRDVGMARAAANFAIGEVPMDLWLLQYFLRLPDPAILLAIDVFVVVRNLGRALFGRGSRMA